MKLRYAPEELLAEHDYFMAHVECGEVLHGGFDEEGNYLTPGSLHRADAVNAWAVAQDARETAKVKLPAGRFTNHQGINVHQHHFVLDRTDDQVLWEALSILAAEMSTWFDPQLPETLDLQPIVQEDLSASALGHLSEELVAQLHREVGGSGHQQMYLVVRNLLIGRDKYPEPELPLHTHWVEQPVDTVLGEPHGRLVSWLLKSYLSTGRARDVNLYYQSLVRSLLQGAETFEQRQLETQHALLLMERIQQDLELQHLWLFTMLREFAQSTFTLGNKTIKGQEVLSAPLGSLALKAESIHDERVETLSIRIFENLNCQKLAGEFLSLSGMTNERSSKRAETA